MYNLLSPQSWHSTIIVMPLFGNVLVVFSILFWAGFAPSIWLWLYVLSLFATRAMLRTDALVTWLRWALDIENRPFQSVGIVAAALAFAISAIILVVPTVASAIA